MLLTLDINLIHQSLPNANGVLAQLLVISTVNFAKSVASLVQLCVPHCF